MEKKQEAKRHHYIPQFILRNFNDENGQVKYYDIETEKLESRNTRSVFMNMHMYRDEINHKDNPTFIETTLAKFEAEIAELFSKKFINTNEVIIDRSELEKIRIFLGLLSFRCDYRSEQYKNNKFDDNTHRVLADYVKDGNYDDLWKREIAELAKMRSFNEFKQSEVIDPIIKMDFEQLLTGYYMTIIDARGGEFLLTDVYPTLEICPLINGTNIHLHFFYPISPTRMLVLNHIMFRKEGKYKINSDPVLGPMKRISEIRGDLLKQPKHILAHPGTYSIDDKYIYRPQKIYARDLMYINSLFLNEARIGVLFKNKDKVFDSVSFFNREDNTKHKLIELEEICKNN